MKDDIKQGDTEDSFVINGRPFRIVLECGNFTYKRKYIDTCKHYKDTRHGDAGELINFDCTLDDDCRTRVECGEECTEEILKVIRQKLLSR